MGRFAHEGAWLAKVEAGKPLVWYMGCDSRNEYIYKYVSSANWDPVDASRGLAAGDKYLDDGKLYVAKFNADGTGNWVELSFGANGITAASTVYPFADQADVLINTRLAADVIGATKMDRPEWGAVDPVTGAVYMTLTNNNATLRSLWRPTPPTRATTTTRAPTERHSAAIRMATSFAGSRLAVIPPRRRSAGTSSCSARARPRTRPTSTSPA